MRFVIITGLSGAGKSQAIKSLEDLGYYCVDNLPPKLIPKFADLCLQSQGEIEKVALVIDIRGGIFFDDLVEVMHDLKKREYAYEILFLDATEEVLIKRFKETRRKHPLAPADRVSQGIKEERKKLRKIKSMADQIIDTSNLKPKELKEEIKKVYQDKTKEGRMLINILSFGFKYGVPLDGDLIFDVRFLPNPFYIKNLKPYTGNDKQVQDYVLDFPETKEFIEKLEDMVEFLIPNYAKEGKSQLVIGIGCTGGKHRSVTIANNLYRTLTKNGHWVIFDHRDIEKDREAMKE